MPRLLGSMAVQALPRLQRDIGHDSGSDWKLVVHSLLAAK
jgi:hypothetical protein